jgi:asparagine synthase (glutamine-hydrolysing)
MLDAIRHRGPDETGHYTDHHIALGHARLSIIDIAGGRQPMQNEDGVLTIVFNGEIFNYLELRETLLARGHRFSTRTDTEVLLHAYEEYGEDCFDRLNGQWAFAIWDRNRRALFMSRDRLGVRPLFYTRVGGAFLFASEIKALFAYPGVSRELDPHALDEIFTFWHTLPPRTAFRNISELPPGCSALVTEGGMRIRRYWDVNCSVSASMSGKSASAAERADEFLALLTDATRLRLRSDVPVAAYLSGGLDSTVIAALAQRFAGRMRTFSVRFDNADLDEGPFQNEAVRYLGVAHQDIQCSSAEIGRFFPSVVRHMETPVVRSAPAPLFLLSRLVHGCGYKVVLTGEGSDEVLGGYDIYKETKVRSFCAAHPESRLRPLLLKRLYPYLPHIQSQPAATLRAFFCNGDDARSPFFSHLPRWRATSRLKRLLSDGVAAELDGENAIDRLANLLPPAYAGWNAFQRAEYLETRYLLPGYILSSQGDRVAMAHAVEGRFPFLDHRVVEFALSLPAHLKMKVLDEKHLLKRCAAGLVPAAILQRHKQPFRAPDSVSFFGPDAPPYVADLLASSQVKHDGIFRADAIENLVKRARAGEKTSAVDDMAATAVISTTLLHHEFTLQRSIGV